MTILSINCFVLLLIICRFAFAQVGDSCEVKSTGASGICRLVSDCPSVEEDAKHGISPTTCGFYQLTMPIVCCERKNFNVLPNENSFVPFEETDSSFVYPENEPLNQSPQQSNFQPQQSNFQSQQSNFQSQQSNVQPTLSKSEQKCQEYSKSVTGVVQAITLVTHTEAVSYNTVKCDYNGVALIVGGQPALAGEFPFMAAIGFLVDNEVEWRCGGTLISDEYVLTAAHCTFARDLDPSIVRLGELDFSRTDDGTVHADYNIRNMVVHPGYRYPQKYNDIALIRLSSRVKKFTKFIRPACLYTKPQIDQQQAVATGWGKTDYAATEISEKLMKVSLNIFSNDHCAKTYQSNKNLPQGIKSSMLCAGELKGGHDTCQGDSGGPLLITKKGNQCQFYIVGVTSFGKSCGQASTPAVYTKVSVFVPWIEETIW